MCTGYALHRVLGIELPTEPRAAERTPYRWNFGQVS